MHEAAMALEQRLCALFPDGEENVAVKMRIRERLIMGAIERDAGAHEVFRLCNEVLELGRSGEWGRIEIELAVRYLGEHGAPEKATEIQTREETAAAAHEKSPKQAEAGGG
jgi:hypothetical protein